MREARGEGLLREVLGEAAYEEYKRRGHIDVPSVLDGGRTGYRIRPGRRIGVLERDFSRNWVEQPSSLCVHAPDCYRYPEGDNVACHVLLCRHDERLLRATANRHARAA